MRSPEEIAEAVKLMTDLLTGEQVQNNGEKPSKRAQIAMSYQIDALEWVLGGAPEMDRALKNLKRGAQKNPAYREN